METDTKKATGRDTVLDVSEEQIGRVYAEAFLGAATATGDAESTVEQLQAVVTEVLEVFPSFSEAVRSAFLSHEERTSLIQSVLGSRVSPVVLNTLKVLSQHNRMPILKTVAKQARQLFDEQNGRTAVEVVSAAELGADQLESIKQTLRAKLGAEPILESRTDPELIGGLTIRVGDTVFDGSVKTVFEKARQSMIERTVALIEQSPEGFVGADPAEA